MFDQDESDSVEQLSTNIKESFSKFQGHWLDPRKADFSGKIASKHHTGYNAWYLFVISMLLHLLGRFYFFFQGVDLMSCKQREKKKQLFKSLIASSVKWQL